ncbi:MAG: sulfite exporter TauE/SafE family protein [Hyphomicrobium sp.]|nr:sulfite exporter TauE/SafE family protein [Hyphomicrobium sp.]
MPKTYSIRRPVLAFTAGAAVSTLGGLIGLGGAEFRLPILITIFALYAHRAVRFNLLVSLVTLSFAAIARAATLPNINLTAYADVVLSMIAGGMISAWIGAGWLARIRPDRLMAIISMILLVVAMMLFAEAAFADAQLPALRGDPVLRSCIGVVAGLLIGAVSSLLGVAGGEFIIPILIFVFGTDIKTAGTMSLLISLPVVLIGVARHRINGHYRSRDAMIYLVLPMAAGSIVGALLGGMMASAVPTNALKTTLAVILAWSAMKLRRRFDRDNHDS